MILDFVSKDVQEYMQQKGLTFSDFEKASLIYHSYLPFLKRTEFLKNLAEETEDEALKGHILENLASDQMWMDAFWNNAEGYVYEVPTSDVMENAFTCDCFATADMAYTHGLKQRGEFVIRKCRIADSPSQEQKESEECVTEQNGDEHWVAEATYSKDGILRHFWSSETEQAEAEYCKRYYDPENYENAFIPFPNPFELGDIVTRMGEGGHGIVSTSQLEWQECLERMEKWEPGRKEFIDANVIVDLLRDDGSIRYRRICPVHLEKYQPNKGEADHDLLLAAQAVVRGKCSLEWFTTCYDNYKKSKENL